MRLLGRFELHYVMINIALVVTAVFEYNDFPIKANSEIWLKRHSFPDRTLE